MTTDLSIPIPAMTPSEKAASDARIVAYLNAPTMAQKDEAGAALTHIDSRRVAENDFSLAAFVTNATAR